MALQPKDIGLSTVALETIRAATKEAAPCEACGVLIGLGRSVVRALPLPNKALKKTTEFEIAPVHFAQAARQTRQQGYDIIGIFHSHPNGTTRPSAKDIRHSAPWGGYFQIIAAFDTGGGVRLSAWQAAPDIWTKLDITTGEIDGQYLCTDALTSFHEWQ